MMQVVVIPYCSSVIYNGGTLLSRVPLQQREEDGETVCGKIWPYYYRKMWK